MSEPSDNVGEAADAVDEDPQLNLLLLPSDVLALMLSALANVSCVARFGHVSHASLAINCTLREQDERAPASG